MKARDRLRAEELDAALARHAATRRALPGIADLPTRATFIHQLIDSLHRVEFPRRLLKREMSVRRTDPSDVEMFDPIRAAVYHAAQGDHDEACWLVFLFVAYGKSRRTGWRLIRDVYGRLGQGGRWDWPTAVADPERIREWIHEHAVALWPPGTPRPFGAHRQHERIDPSAETIATYMQWIGRAGHRRKFDAAWDTSGADSRRTFDTLYQSMPVHRFGRLAKFDYLAMLGKLDLAPVEPASTYMKGATGPVNGARLLFGGRHGVNIAASVLDDRLRELDADLRVGMQVLEDALCNWQKSPATFRRFRG